MAWARRRRKGENRDGTAERHRGQLERRGTDEAKAGKTSKERRRAALATSSGGTRRPATDPRTLDPQGLAAEGAGMGTLQRLFRHELASLTPRHARVSRNYEIWYNVNDFAAGLLFVAGSVLFFWESTTYVAIWLFVVGSVLFCVRPGIRLARELHLSQLPTGPENEGGAG